MQVGRSGHKLFPSRPLEQRQPHGDSLRVESGRSEACRLLAEPVDHSVGADVLERVPADRFAPGTAD